MKPFIGVIILFCNLPLFAQEYNGYSQPINKPTNKKKDTIIVDTAYLNSYYRLCKLYGITPIIFQNEKVAELLKRVKGNYGEVATLRPLPNRGSLQDSTIIAQNSNQTEITESSSGAHYMVLDEGNKTPINTTISPNNQVEGLNNQVEVVDQLAEPTYITPISNTPLIENNITTNNSLSNESIQTNISGQSSAIPVRKNQEPPKTIVRAQRDTVVNPIDQGRRNLMKFGGSDTKVYVPEEEVGIRVDWAQQEAAKNETQPTTTRPKSTEQKARQYPSSYLSVSSGANEEQDVVGIPLDKNNKPLQVRHNIYLPTPAPQSAVTIEQAQFDKELNFVVQIAACKKPLTPTYLAQLYKNGRRIMVLQEGGWYKYFIVSSGSYEYAKKTLGAVPVDGAFIAAYTKDGTKKALWQAKQEAKLKQADGEMTYVVQLAASRKPATNFELRRLYYNPEKIIVIKENGWYKYQLSFGNSLEDALAFKKTLKYNEESFITGYDKNGIAHMIK